MGLFDEAEVVAETRKRRGGFANPEVVQFVRECIKRGEGVSLKVKLPAEVVDATIREFAKAGREIGGVGTRVEPAMDPENRDSYMVVDGKVAVKFAAWERKTRGANSPATAPETPAATPAVAKRTVPQVRR